VFGLYSGVRDCPLANTTPPSPSNPINNVGPIGDVYIKDCVRPGDK